VLDGLTARRIKNPTDLRRVLIVGAPLPVAVWPFAEMLRAADWSAVIDARMRKRAVPEGQRGLAPSPWCQ
jgi:xanthine dehydrogenase accessory factor